MTDKDSNFSPLEIPLVLRNVFKYLFLHELKQSRLVSKLWNDEGLPILLRRSQFNFDLTGYSFGRRNTRLIALTLLNDVQNFEIINAEIKLLRFHDRYVRNAEQLDSEISLNGKSILDVSDEIDSWFGEESEVVPEPFPIRRGSRLACIWQDINKFLKCHSSLRSLTLFGPFISETTCALFMLVLSEVSKCNIYLEELELKISLGPSYFDAASITNFSVSFPVLHTIRIRVNYQTENQQRSTTLLKELINVLLSGMKNLKTIHVNGFLKMEELILEEIKTKWPYMKITGLSILQPLRGCLHRLLSLPVSLKLKKLELQTTATMVEEILSKNGIEQLLERHSTSLDTLYLTLYRPRTDARLKMYVFPALKRLRIGLVGHYYAGRLTVMPRRSNRPNVDMRRTPTFLFVSAEGDQIEYSRDFPRLTSLELWTSNKSAGFPTESWEEEQLFFESFIPLDSSESDFPKCWSLKDLRIPHINIIGDKISRGERLTSMFPNVNNPWINQARKGLE